MLDTAALRTLLHLAILSMIGLTEMLWSPSARLKAIIDAGENTRLKEMVGALAVALK
jgi:hypothetical protein